MLLFCFVIMFLHFDQIRLNSIKIRKFKITHQSIPTSHQQHQTHNHNQTYQPHSLIHLNNNMSILKPNPLTAQLITTITQQDQIQKVYKLNATSLNLTKIESSIKKYNRLRCLIIDFNYIEKIENINSLFDLRELHIEGNLLTKIEGLETCKNLTVLNLANNKIEKIEGISHLNKLEQLNLSKNQLQKIAQLETLKQLKLINLSHNSILSLDSLPAISKLQTLLLNHNKIQSIPIQKFINCSKLTKLDLSHNQLSQCKFISKLSNLESLNLAHNRLAKFQIQGQLKFLEQIQLQHNHLEWLPSIGAYFPQLVVLNVNSNMFCSQHEFITMLSESQMLAEIQFADNPISSPTFDNTLFKLFSFDRINKKTYNQPGAKYLIQINDIQETFTHEFADIEDDEDDRKIRMSGFYNDDLECKMTGIKPHRAVSPATKKAKLIIGNDYTDIAKNFTEFLENDKRIKLLRQQYESICLQNNIEKPIVQPYRQESNIYLTQGQNNEQNSLHTRQSITQLRLRNDTNQKLMKETIKQKEEKWAQLKARTKEKSFNIRKSRVKEVNGSLPKHSVELQRSKIQPDLMRTQLIPGKFKQRLLENPVKTGTMFYRPSSQK